MYYTDTPSNALRFGDVVKGFMFGHVFIEKPFESFDSCKVHLETGLCVILTPCCTIQKSSKISVAPLRRIKYKWSNNTYFREDFTNVNREMEPHQTLPEIAWEKMPEEERIKKLATGKTYAELNLFVYPPCNSLPVYTLKGSEYQHHMIDFSEIHQVEFNQEFGESIEAKVLELTIQKRNELRDKLTHYFNRQPKEDIIDLPDV